MDKLILVNYAPPFTSVYKYTLEIKSCIDKPTQIVNLKYTNRSGNWNYPAEGVSFNGLTSNIIALNIMFSKRSFRKAADFIKKERDDGTIVHYTHQNIRPISEPDAHTVVTVHDNPETNLKFGVYTNRPDNFVERTYFKLFSHMIRTNYLEYSKFPNVITHSDYVRNSLIEFGFKGKITTVYPAVGAHFTKLNETEGLRKKLGLPDDKKLVLSVSSTHKRKNLETVSKVMGKLGNQYKLVRVGPPLNDSITFNKVSTETINEIYNACDVMLMPSTEEGFGTPIPEAFTVGLPVVASNIPVFKQTFGDYILMNDPFDVDGLASSIVEACNTKDAIAEREISRSKLFSYKEYKKRINKYYKSIVNEDYSEE